MRENYGNVKYLDPIVATKDVVKILREKEKCDLVICLSHLGWETGDEEPSDERVVPQTEGVDLFLGGHTHTYMNPAKMVENASGKQVPVSQNGKSGMYLSRFDVHLK